METFEKASIRKSTWRKILNFIASSDYPTPYLLLDAAVIREKAGIIGKGLRNARTFYAVKAHPAREVVELIASLGLNFEIASEGELRLLREVGIGPERIISSNPVKSPSFLREAKEFGLQYFAFDSAEEIEKIATLCPDAGIYLRVSVPNEGSEWPLSRKFGVEPDEALSLILMAVDRGLSVVGTTFHVGSQCNNIYNWQTALDKVASIWEASDKKGIKMKILNIGGGYPIRYRRDVAEIEEIERLIDAKVIERFPPDVEIHVEPGRALVGDAGVFVTSVIGKAVRGKENWLYIDAGVFNGLMEVLGGIRYSCVVGSRAPEKRWKLAGPSCDSLDVIDQDIVLPEPMIGDHLLIASAGAYTISYASEFNGFAIPRTILI